MEIYERKSISMSCTSVNRPNKRVEVESVLHLLFYILKKEKAKKDALKGNGRTFLFMIVSILPISLFRRKNLKSCPKYFFSESGD